MDSFIITTAGRRVEMQPVAQRDIERVVAVVEREFREAGEPLEPPWYWSVEPDEKGEGGEKIFWDAASVAKDGTEEEKQAWAKHQEATNRLEKAKEARATEMMLLKGIKNDEDKRPTPEWVKEQAYFGIELPSDPKALSLEFIQSEVLKTPFDLIQATKKVALLNISGVVSDEEVKLVEKSFQDAMEEAGRVFIGQNLSQLTGNNGAEAKQVGDVAIQPTPERLEGGPILGADLA